MPKENRHCEPQMPTAVRAFCKSEGLSARMTTSSVYSNKVTRGALGPSPSATPGQAARTAVATLSNNRPLPGQWWFMVGCRRPDRCASFYERLFLVGAVIWAHCCSERHFTKPHQNLYAHQQKRRRRRRAPKPPAGTQLSCHHGADRHVARGLSRQVVPRLFDCYTAS